MSFFNMHIQAFLALTIVLVNEVFILKTIEEVSKLVNANPSCDIESGKIAVVVEESSFFK